MENWTKGWMKCSRRSSPAGDGVGSIGKIMVEEVGTRNSITILSYASTLQTQGQSVRVPKLVAFQEQRRFKDNSSLAPFALLTIVVGMSDVKLDSGFMGCKWTCTDKIGGGDFSPSAMVERLMRCPLMWLRYALPS